MKEIHCEEPWFTKIKQGIKTVEGRKFSNKFASLKSGEILKFCCDSQSFLTQVVKVVPYKSLDAYLHSEGISKVLPGIENFHEALEVYLGYNTNEDLDAAGGFLAIHIKVME
jgi:ASC-1-like (ASCH) protein